MKNTWIALGAAASLLAAAPAFAQHDHGKHEGHGHASPAKPAVSYGPHAKGRKVEVAVTKDGFVPAKIDAKKGEVLNLVVTRKVDQTCATEVVQKEQGVFAPLPLNEPVTVTLRAPEHGELRFHCAHGHIGGHVVAQ